MTHIDADKMMSIVSTLVEGLISSFAEEKQYALEEVLRILVEEEFEECKAAWGWEDGIKEV